ncbi:CPBP family glutamic-type intramembrane protease [Bifidobacterium choladohabitans]|uniref:CPBP family glutamic-type intramembrane protease n=1 Tax=Bifidobacterium choladohabitans TaxID=2750947 RepID=UPI0018DBB30B|nr:CPBP family glutamic-type intramembrane protease [Bifidobacterium choladohabitans]MBI0048574.1 CPBP family intramembrane metalloprotease [Bifidobacterium choladohabitans]
MRDDEDRDSGSESADAQSDQGRLKVSRSSIALMTASHSASKDYARHWDYEEGSISLPPLSLPGEAVDDGLAYPGRIAHRKTALLGDDGAGGKGHKGAMPVGERPSVLPGSYDFLNSVTMASQPEVPTFPPEDLPVDGQSGKDSGQESSPRRVVVRRELEASKATGTATEISAQPEKPAVKVVWSWTKPETNKGPVFSWNMPKRRKPSTSTRAGKPAASAPSANAVDSAVPVPSKVEQESSKASAPVPSAVETAEPKSMTTAGAPSASGSGDPMSAKTNPEVSAPAASAGAPATPVVFADRPVVVRRSVADWDSLVTGSPAPAENGAAARSVASGADHQGRRVCSTPRLVAQPAAVAGDGTGGRVVSSKAVDGQGTALAQRDHVGQPVQTGQGGIAVQPAPSESSVSGNAAPGRQSVVQFASSPTSVSSPGASVALAAKAAEAAAAAVAAKAESAGTEDTATDATKPSGSSHGPHLGLSTRGRKRSGGARRSSKRRSARNRTRPSAESAAPRVVSNVSAESVPGASRPAPVSSWPIVVPSELDTATPAAAVAAQPAAKKSIAYTASSGVLHAVNGQAAFAFVYLAISVLVLMVGSGMILPVIMEQVKDPRSIAFLSDGITLLSVLLALTYACTSEWSVIRGEDQRGQDAVHWRTDRRMTLAALLALVAVLLLGQGMVHELNKFLNHFCLLLHIPSLASRSLLVTGASSPMMALYALLAVPLAEELVFRGIILNGLRRFGRVFAILTASLLCALLQCDPVSGLWIFLLGLALGYCSLEYGLIWAIGARVVGDLLFTGLPNRYLMNAPRTARLSVLAVALVLVLAGLLMFFLHRASLLDYRRRYRAPKGTYVSWRQPWFLLYLLLCLLLAIFKFVPGLL